MFPWNIAKSAEAMFSRWAVKHVLKFLLKKKLGQFILGDLDLDQLEVQISSGTIQLTDLALNVDYINQKLGSLPVTLKEGSIGSLLAKIPWRVSSCQIEVDELELVFIPCVKEKVSAADEPTSSNESCRQHVSVGQENFGHSSTAVPLDVHEGVKTIAKMVKWLLTSFHIKVKKIIVAYDPYSDKDVISGSHRSLVFRISELEYGTCVSEGSKTRPNARVDSLLGLSKLTNFVKFQGAIVEFLQMDDVENQKSQTQPPGSPETISNEWPIGTLPSEATTPILTGEGGGFSGNLKLSIPWRNGSLDIHKVDADVSVDPIDLRLEPSTIAWILCLWQSLKNVDQDGQGHMHDNYGSSIYFSSASQFHHSTMGSASISTERVLTGSGSAGFSSQTSRETPRDALLRASHVIPDWVALSTNINQNGSMETEPDLSESIDQFFECFDGLRTSQSALGNNGILNWTCPVFSAITAASSLASGSVLLPSEQQPIETNFKASFSGISVELNLSDEDRRNARDSDGKSSNDGKVAHYLGATCQGLLLSLQICPRETKFEATVQHIELDDYFTNANEAAGSGLGCESTIYNQSLSIQNLQAEVQGALPTFPLSQDLEATKASFCSNEIPSKLVSGSNRVSNISSGTTPKDDLVKMKLLKTSSVTSCQFSLQTVQLNGTKTSSTSFSVKLPPFIFWLNFNLVKELLDLFKQMENSIEMKNQSTGSGFEDVSAKFKSPSPGDMKGPTSPCLTISSSQGSMKGSVSFSNARIIFCFSEENHGDSKSYALWHQFIGLDITRALSKESSSNACLTDTNFPLSFADKFSGAIYLNAENLKMYLISGTSKKDTKFAQEILSVTAGTKRSSCFGVLWQDGHVTGPWVATRARGLVSSQDSTRSRTRVTGKGSEFASVTTMGDQEDISSCTQEMILSSTYLVHIRVPSVSVKLTTPQYQLLHHLLDQIVGDFSPKGIEKEVSSTSQTSVLVECSTLEVNVNMEKLEDIKSSLQTELPGSWQKLKLQVQNFELLSVSNIGGVCGCKFFWLGHGEGKLWGCIDQSPAEELVLISCSDSTMHRGGGEGANAMSSGSSGTAVIYLLDPQISKSFTTVTIRGGTIVAPGGRLDWSNAICDFFSLPSEDDHKGSSQDSRAYSASFVLNLVDIGLSYEPWINKLVTSGRDFESESKEEYEEHVACLLAAASLNLSNQTTPSCTQNNFKIRLQDLGLLLCASSGRQSDDIRDVEYLRKAGYVKVAGEALVEAVLRTNCNNGLLWELELCDSQITLDTCHDTTAGLLRLGTQLQQLFAPDLQESMVHLQSRWKAVQQVNCSNDFTKKTNNFDGGSASSTQDGMVGVMDDICEDAFQFNGGEKTSPDRRRLQSSVSLGEAYCSNVSNPEYFSRNVPLNDPMLPGSGITHGSFPKIIEGYCGSGTRSLPEMSSNLKSKSKNRGHAAASSGWYRDDSLRIVENHIMKLVGTKLLRDRPNPDICKPKGRVVVKNIDVRWRMFGGSDWYDSNSTTKGGRDTSLCLELTLSTLDLQYDMYPDDGVSVSKLSLSVKDFTLYDHSRDAPWKLVLGYYHSKDRPRESSAKAFKLDLEAVRPDPSTPLEEYRLRLAVLPMLLHLDQDQLDFLISFFGGKELLVDQSSSDSTMPSTKSNDISESTITEEALLPFFQKFDIWPVVIRVDYSPRHVDLAALQRGNYVHLVNLVPWKGIELQLKHVHAVGIYGWNSVCETILGEWLEDISHNQIHKLLKGLPPIRSLFTVGSGAAKLVSLPVKNYKKDQRLIKGIQRGAIAFVKSISLEAIGLGVHLAAGAHDILLQTEYIVTSVPKTNTNVRLNQPKDAQQGMVQAYESLSDGLGKSASALVGNPLKTFQRGGGAGSALASAVCAAPSAAIAPASAAVRAVHCALLGVRNSLDPEHKKESMEKYSGAGPDRNSRKG